ncbi:MAG TPA: FecR family protein [Acetobacteraceae bacterium]|nr:FecR family protein [Acetobacteraceae bacterium]
MEFMRKEFGTLCTMLGLVLWIGAASAAAPTGTVVAVSGSCTAHGRALKSGDAVQLSDTVDVPAGGHLKLQMADGSVISIGPDSNMTVLSYNVGDAGRQANLSLAQGVLRAVVAPVGGPSTFEVSTAVGTASVHSGSADWFIVAEAGSAQVGVLAGTVDLTSAATRGSVAIPAHWGTRLESGLAPMLPRVWAQMEFNAVIRLTECCQSAQPKLEMAPVR